MGTKKQKKKNRAPAPTPEPRACPAPQATTFDILRHRALLYLFGITPLVFFRTGGEFENSPKMALLQWGTAVLALLSLFHGFRGKPLVWKRSPLDIPLLVFYLFCCLSLLQAANPWQGVFYLLHWGAALLMYFLLVHCLSEESQIDDLTVAICLSIIPVGIVGVAQWLVAHGWTGRIAVLEQIPQMTIPAATFSNSNMVALVLAIALPLSINALLFAHREWVKVACAISIGCNLLLLLCTRTRGAWLAGIAVLLILAVRWVSHALGLRIVRIPLRYLTVAVLCVLVLLYFPLKQIDSGSTTLRWIWWKNTAFMIKDHLVWGVGLGNFKVVYPLYHRAAKDHQLSESKDWSFGEATQLTRTHNDHLQIFAETGALGFAAYLAILCVFLSMLRIVLRQDTEPVRRRAQYLGLSFLAFCIVGTTNFPLERALPPFYLFLCFAALTVLYRKLPAPSGANRTAAQRLYAALFYPADVCIAPATVHRMVRTGLCLLLALFLAGSFTFIRRMVLADRYFVESLAYSDHGRLDKAEECLKKAEQIFSAWNFNIASLLGRNYTMQEQYEKAIAQYQESLRVHPYNTNALLNTGYCYLKLEKLDEAEQFFKRFLAIMPDAAKGYNNLGIVYFSKKEYARAAACYQKAFELDPGYGEAHFNLGNVYRAQGKTEEALQEYEAALRAKPDLQDVRTMLITMYLERGDFEKAEQVVRPLLHKPQTAVQGHMLLGNLFQRRGKYEQALFQYLQAVQRAPQDATIYYAIGMMHLQLGNYDKAATSFTYALQHDPSLTDAATMLGQLRLQQGDEQGALDIFRSALQRDPRNRDLHFNIGTIYLRMNNLDQAIHHYRETIAIDPSHSLAHYNLGTILRQQGRLVEALYHFQEALRNPAEQIDSALANKFIADIKAALAQAGKKEDKKRNTEPK